MTRLAYPTAYRTASAQDWLSKNLGRAEPARTRPSPWSNPDTYKTTTPRQPVNPADVFKRAPPSRPGFGRALPRAGRGASIISRGLPKILGRLVPVVGWAFAFKDAWDLGHDLADIWRRDGASWSGGGAPPEGWIVCNSSGILRYDCINTQYPFDDDFFDWRSPPFYDAAGGCLDPCIGGQAVQYQGWAGFDGSLNSYGLFRSYGNPVNTVVRAVYIGTIARVVGEGDDIPGPVAVPYYGYGTPLRVWIADPDAFAPGLAPDQTVGIPYHLIPHLRDVGARETGPKPSPKSDTYYKPGHGTPRRTRETREAEPSPLVGIPLAPGSDARISVFAPPGLAPRRPVTQEVVFSPSRPPTITPPRVRTGWPQNPGRKKDEEKVRNNFAIGALKIVGEVTEAKDFADSMFKGLPKKTRAAIYKKYGVNPKRLMPWQKAVAIGENWDQFSAEEAVKAWFMNELEDRGFGWLGQEQARAARKARPHGNLPFGFSLGPAL